MQATINLTAVLITCIICVTLYALCRLARKDDTKKSEKQKEPKLLEYVNRQRSGQEQHLVDYVEDQIKKEKTGK